ncbi:hypothetical protein SynBOUM118_01134 [Synechococcus sp. BOUM118]|nr:hypothetical protein SynBOUM118_01134 [Synechococcus sp. BOUM118]
MHETADEHHRQSWCQLNSHSRDEQSWMNSGAADGLRKP